MIKHGQNNNGVNSKLLHLPAEDFPGKMLQTKLNLSPHLANPHPTEEASDQITFLHME